MIRFPNPSGIERCPDCGDILTEDGECRCAEIDWQIDEAMDERNGDGLGAFRALEFAIYFWLLIFAAWRVVI